MPMTLSPPAKIPTRDHLLLFAKSERTLSDLADWCHRHGFRFGQAKAVLLSLVESGAVTASGTKTKPRFVATNEASTQRPVKRRPRGPQPLALPGIL